MPKVSVIIPVYNVEKYLIECLDSVVNQTLKDIEIICVNDGSTDNSLQIIQEYAAKDERIKVIDKPNSGYGHSMNVGIDNATSEYLGIVEPDDYVELNMYETLYNKAKELDLDFIKADFCRFEGDNDNRIFSYAKIDKTRELYNKVLSPCNCIRSFNLVMNTWTGIYNLEFLRKYHIRHNETPGASFQDNGFWFQTFMYADRVYFLDTAFYQKRKDNPNSSVKNKSKVYCMCEEYDYIRNIIDKNSNFEKFIPIYQYKRYCNYLFTLNRIDKKFKKEFIKKFSQDFKLAMQNNEIDKSLFGDGEYQNLELIINKPDKFYRKHLHKQLVFEKIFSIKNKDKHKIITILGVKLKLKNKKAIKRFNEIQAIETNKQIKDFEYKLCKYMPEEKYPEYLKDWFYKCTGEELNLDNPQTFNEKIQWMKLYDSTPLKTRLADKYLVRDWVKEKIGEEYLIPLLGVWENFEDIDFDKLPDKFVLKTNHGSAWNIIVSDKSKFDLPEAKQKLNKWLHTNYAFKTGLELHYKDIKPLIIAEKYLETEDNDLKDYKFLCFNGEVKYIWVDKDRYTNHKRNLFDSDWNLLNEKIGEGRIYENWLPCPKPKNLDKMLQFAKLLSKDINFVRVDFYEHEDRLYFGEMTFTSASGVHFFAPSSFNYALGELIQLPNCK